MFTTILLASAVSAPSLDTPVIRTAKVLPQAAFVTRECAPNRTCPSKDCKAGTCSANCCPAGECVVNAAPPVAQPQIRSASSMGPPTVYSTTPQYFYYTTPAQPPCVGGTCPLPRR